MNVLSAFSEADRLLLERVKAAVLALEPTAEVALFGSRARGEERDESDWDILALVDGDADFERKRRIRRALYDIEFETGAVVSATIKSRDDWRNSPLLRITPFYETVSREALFY